MDHQNLKYVYFVSYKYSTHNSWGFGNAEALCDSEITSMDQVKDIQKKIFLEKKESESIRELIIENYIFLRKELRDDRGKPRQQANG